MNEADFNKAEEILESHAWVYLGSGLWRDAVTSSTYPTSIAIKIQEQRLSGRTLKKKNKKYKISKERILQISNDISEEMCTATPDELVEVVKYFRDEFDAVWQKRLIERSELAFDLLKKGTELMKP